jgi:hypothetical protein
VNDRELRALETRRGEILHAMISQIMPEVSVEHDAAVTAFRAHLGGSVLAWLGQDDPDARRFLVLRTRDWLRLAGIAFSEALASELSEPIAQSATGKARASTRRPRKVTATTKGKTRKTPGTRR